MKVVLLKVYGVMHPPFSNPISGRCLVMPTELTDSMCDDILRLYEDISYVISSGEPIVGEHNVFTIHSYDVLEEMEVPAVC
jgi:hypothetical protein